MAENANVEAETVNQHEIIACDVLQCFASIEDASS